MASKVSEKKDIITLNGVSFGKGKSSLDGGGVQGFYRRTGSGELLLFDRGGNRVGGVRLDGMIYRSSRLKDDGRLFHQPAAPEIVGGLDYPLMRQYEEAKTALQVSASQQ